MPPDPAFALAVARELARLLSPASCDTGIPSDTRQILRRRAAGNAIERFWSKVDKRGAEECWRWSGYRRANGYCLFTIAHRPLLAHRYAFELEIGPIPEGKVVLHGCGNRDCMNPQHMRLGTQADNVADMIARGRNVHGERTTGARLTEDAVRAIRRALGDGSETQRSLAQRYDVAEATISHIRHRRSWKHVKD